MSISYLQTKCHSLVSIGPLVISGTLKAKLKFRMATMLMFHILQKIALTKLYIFRRPITTQHFKILYSQVRASAMLLLLSVNNLNG